MFKPKYSISAKLLGNIKQITTLVTELNYKKFPKVILMKLEKRARETSAYSSTSIEGNPLSLTDVKKILKNAPINARNTEIEVLNYNRILLELNESPASVDSKLTLDLILKIHKGVTFKLLSAFHCGKLRKEPVVVKNPRIGKIVYLPPDHQDVKALMTDLVDFVRINRQQIDSLILAGIFHKQFVVIHPFIDGNGRTARLATKVLLASMGLDTFNLFSFENYYNNNVAKYFEMVGVVGNYYDLVNDVDFTAWLEYFTDGIIDELLRVKKILNVAVINPQTELRPYHQKMLDYIEKNGYITDLQYSKLVRRAKATRNLDFNKLIELGLIKRLGKGKNTHYKLKAS